jgi:hypothetical protein
MARDAWDCLNAAITRFLRQGKAVEASVIHSAAAWRSCPCCSYPDTARAVRAQTSGPLPGWFQFRPLWDQITAEEPDLFD